MRTPYRLAAAVAALLTLAACKATTTRPYFPPVTGAPQTEIELGVNETTEAFADILRGDSLPVTRSEPRDGFVETAWFEVQTKRTHAGRPVGPDVVQVRAWANPSRPGHTRLIVETVYHPLADPSLTPRQLDRQAPPDHPVAKRMTEILTQLTKLYSTEPQDAEPAAPAAAAPAPAPAPQPAKP